MILCDKGLKDCIRYGRHTFFNHLLYNKGHALINLGREDEAHERIREAYYICRAMGERAGEVEAIRRFADKKGIKLI